MVFPQPYDLAVEVSAWNFGPETFVALGTLLLAAGTGLLAWSTRRLATESAREVQAQSRPIIFPQEDSLEISVDGGNRRKVDMVIRNVGAGPALDVKIVEGASRMPWYSSPDIAVIPAGGAYNLHLPFFDIAGAGDYTSSGLTVQYNDLAGLSYATEMVWSAAPEYQKMLKVVVSDGYRDPRHPRPPMGDPFQARKPPLRRRLYGAALALWPPPGDTPDRLSTRLRAANRRLKVERTQTQVQRVRWGIRRAKFVHNRDVPDHFPEWLGGVFLLSRRIRWGFHAYRNIR
jgi:hypothetical protein